MKNTISRSPFRVTLTILLVACVLLLSNHGSSAISKPDQNMAAQASTVAPLGSPVTVSYEVTVTGELPPGATLFVRTSPTEPIKLMGGSYVAPQLVDVDGDGVYTTQHQHFDSLEYHIEIVQGVGSYTPAIGGAFPGEPTTVLHDFGVQRIAEPTTMRAEVEPATASLPETVALPSDNISQVNSTTDGDSETVWVTVEDRLFSSNDGGQTFAEARGDWTRLSSESVNLYPSIQRNLLLVDDGYTVTPIIGGILGKPIYQFESWRQWTFAPDFTTSGEILAVGADPEGLTNMWYSRDFGASFEPIAFEQNNHLDIVSVHWGNDGIWILQTNVDDTPLLGAADLEALISDVYFAPSPEGPWERDETWKALGQAPVMSASHLFTGPGAQPCLVAQAYEKNGSLYGFSSSRFVACRTDEAWVTVPWPELPAPFNPYGETYLVGLEDDGFGERTVWYPSDGSIYTMRPDLSQFYLFKSPAYEGSALSLPDLPERIAINDIDVSPSGKLYAATEVGLFRSDDQGETWAEVTSSFGGARVKPPVETPGDATDVLADSAAQTAVDISQT